jgi:hypothetical protein
MISNLSRTAKRMTPLAQRSMASPSLNDDPKRVLVSGAAGQIAYSILFRIAR